MIFSTKKNDLCAFNFDKIEKFYSCTLCKLSAFQNNTLLLLLLMYYLPIAIFHIAKKVRNISIHNVKLNNLESS